MAYAKFAVILLFFQVSPPGEKKNSVKGISLEESVGVKKVKSSLSSHFQMKISTVIGNIYILEAADAELLPWILAKAVFQVFAQSAVLLSRWTTKYIRQSVHYFPVLFEGPIPFF